MPFISKLSQKKNTDRKKLPPPSAWGHYRVRRGKKAAGRYTDSKRQRETVLSVKELTLGYGEVEVIHDLSFSLREGDHVSVIGDNGSGKSTLFSALCRLSRPWKGSIDYIGIGQNEIGVLHQQSEISPDFPATVYEVVLTGCLDRYGRGPFLSRAAKKEAFANMEKLGITSLSAHPFGSLSGGQKQRVLLARALCSAKRMLLLDEPVTGLDIKSSADIYALIEHLKSEGGMTVIEITHDIPSALKYSSHILRLSEGSCFFGRTEEYLSLDEAKKYIQEAEDASRDLPYGEGGFRYTGGAE